MWDPGRALKQVRPETGSPQESWTTGCSCLFFPSPGRSQELRPLTYLFCARRAAVRSYMLHQTTVSVLTNLPVAGLCLVLLVHWDKQDKSQSLSSSSKSWCICHVVQLSFPSQGKAVSWGFACPYSVLSQIESLCRVLAQITISVPVLAGRAS